MHPVFEYHRSLNISKEWRKKKRKTLQLVVPGSGQRWRKGWGRGKEEHGGEEEKGMREEVSIFTPRPQ